MPIMLLHRNRDEVNRKTRERMAWLRALDVTVAPEVLAARLEARRATAKKYREKHQWTLKMKAREARACTAAEQEAARAKKDRQAHREEARRRAADWLAAPHRSADARHSIWRVLMGELPPQPVMHVDSGVVCGYAATRSARREIRVLHGESQMGLVFCRVER
ncbi:hypothetical protein B0H12DRAFT_1069918 [Mycena haematopus]|nr:hypothetical protein B0H12DRAFT_1069918 [Mycena haematopus]